MACVDIHGMSVTLTLVDQLSHAVKKRSADENLVLADESEASGWSSAVSDRRLALRRRRGPASSSCRRGCIVVTEGPDCRAEEAVQQVVLGEIEGAQLAAPEIKASSVEELVYWTVL
ncbi:hypothetical protein CFC21_056646 [Triticum aestivum]|uniref:Uncharacterized protein n=2 Tax=Triticum aestivum TaxID=4565 RepID=A0A9R1GIL4_WHEAT|nr:uncharacterized protein LOC119295014 [Triticum dicoccoides]KAF7047759.1 hypothetical protein CFC21_056642 [Triticum aestivum]KAF7047760.1 hypothetical protein CFC21_056643 [Triticum aestivum]KAF7047762.1 hypothetical protein CFC21_056645 [Triticum aestivum]KAF7047763.1 hypothetical protein CFC21_056646 [Triticum aestivum]